MQCECCARQATVRLVAITRTGIGTVRRVRPLCKVHAEQGRPAVCNVNKLTMQERGKNMDYSARG